MNEAYREQVRLMLDLLPFIADESIFARRNAGTVPKLQHHKAMGQARVRIG
jgi:hypothetical protein